MKLKELGNVCHECMLHLIDITKHPGVDCGSVSADYFYEVGDTEKYHDYEVVNIYPNDENCSSMLRVEIKEK